MSTSALTLDVAGRTDPGLVRDRNEDHFVVADLERLASVRATNLDDSEVGTRITDQGTVLMVADGIGGHGSGDVASAVALSSMVTYVTSAIPWFARVAATERAGELAEELGRAMHRCQERLVRVAASDGLDRRLGTTLTMAWLAPPALFVVHAGDSRCYLWRDGKLEQVTTDHTAAEQLRAAGRLRGKRRHVLDSVLVNAVGGGTPELQAEFHDRALSPGDRVLLCTDGLTCHVGDREIAAMLADEAPADETCERLVELACDRGGTDNVTAVVARVCAPDPAGAELDL